MNCPNCGTKLNEEASFCAKCRKNVAYITEKKEVETPKRVGKQNDGFYCNRCGGFVLPEDNYCFECGNKTLKKYYTRTLPVPGAPKPIAAKAEASPPSKELDELDREFEEKKSNTKYMILGVLLIAIVLGAIVGYYMFSQME
jgi:hypothetical protein